TPPTQTVEITKGAEARVAFDLKPEAQSAGLQITGATPGAVVQVDQMDLGTVQSDGTFSASGISPGEHRVLLRKDGMRPQQITGQFRAGQTYQVTGGQAVLSKLVGTLRLHLTPSDS